MQRLCQTQEALARSPEPGAHGKVLDDNPERIRMLVFEERGKPVGAE